MPAIFHLRGLIALALAKLGFRIFPLIPGGKTPAIEKWPDCATTDEALIRAWWSHKDYNIGLVTGPYSRVNGGSAETYWLVVVDYDMKDGQLGASALLRHELFGLSDTKTSKTPNGIHKFYWATVAIPNSLSRIAPNVDVRGTRGYVVAPGSTIKDVTYQWIGEFTEPAPFPEEFAKLALKPSDTGKLDQKTHSKAPIGELDRADSLERAKLYLVNEAPEAIEGSHGDETTYRVAAYVKDLGLSEQACLDQLLAHWNEEKAIPPWPYDQLRTKVSNAYRYGQNAPGSADPLNEFGAGSNVGTSGPKDQTTRQTDDPLGRITREPLQDESFAAAAAGARDGQARPLIEGILGQGELSVMYGIPGSGKTFAALDMAYAVATGAPWNGMKTAQGAVLYVAAEGGPAVRARFLALQTKYAVEDVPIRLLRYPLDMRTGTFDAKRLIQLIKDREHELGIKFLMVVIDTLTVALAGGNDTEHMQAYLYNAKLIQTATGANVFSIHHPGKDPGKGLRGHTALRDITDSIIEVYAPPGSKAGAMRRFIVHKLRNNAVPEVSFRFKLETLELGVTQDGVKLSSCVVRWEGDDTDDMVVEMTPSEKALYEVIERWADATGEDKNNVSAALLSTWLKTDEPENALTMAKSTAMRKAISRLRQQGYLEMREENNE